MYLLDKNLWQNEKILVPNHIKNKNTRKWDEYFL